MNIKDKEQTIVDDSKNINFLQNIFEQNNSFSSIENVELELEFTKAFDCLSDMEQAVIFLLFNEDLKQNVASDMLEIYSKSISRIKKRALEKLKKYLGDDYNEK